MYVYRYCIYLRSHKASGFGKVLAVFAGIYLRSAIQQSRRIIVSFTYLSSWFFPDYLERWISFDQILMQMPLAVFTRLVPLMTPGDDPGGCLLKAINCESLSFLPLKRQTLFIIRHIMRNRHFVVGIRGLLFGLQCMGLVAEGLSDGFFPDRTQLYYVRNSLLVKETPRLSEGDLVNGKLDIADRLNKSLRILWLKRSACT